MKKQVLLIVLLLAMFSLQGCGSKDNATPAATTPTTDPTTPTTDPTTPTTDPTTPTTTVPTDTVLSTASLGTLTDIGDYLNPAGEEWFFASTTDVSSAGTIIGESPGNRLIFWDPASPNVLTQVPNPGGGYYDDYYGQKTAGGTNEFVAYEVLQINDVGQVIGNRYAGADEARGFIWDSVSNTFIDLAPPNFINDAGDREFGQYSKVVDVNDKGEVLLTTDNSEGVRHAYFWDGITTTPVNDLKNEAGTTLPAFNVPNLQQVPSILRATGDEAVALNDGGTPSGDTQVVTTSLDSGVYYDFSIGGWAALGTLADATTATPVDINNNKHIVGMSGNEGFFWDGGVMYPISNPTGAAVEVVDINNNDIVVGNSGGQGFVWSIDPATQKGVFSAIGSLGGGTSTVVAINDRDEVIGQSTTGNTYSEGNVTADVEHAFLWKNKVMYDLGAHSPPNYVYPFNPDFYFSEATAISESGIVVGNSYSINGHSRGFTLTPVFP